MNGIRRRQFLGVAGALALSPLAQSQPIARRYRIAILWKMPKADCLPYRASLTQRLAMHGFDEGKNLSIEDLNSVNSFSIYRAYPALLEKLTATKLDAIFALTSGAVESAISVARSVPIVFAWVPDPVRLGIVNDYARPGGNVTGVSFPFSDIAVKRLELLRELLPAAKRILVTTSPAFPYDVLAVTRLHKAASRLGFDLVEQDIGYLGAGYVHGLKDQVQAVLVTAVFSWTGAVHFATGNLVQPALKEGLPVIFAETEMVEAGGLISYGIDLSDDVRRGADMLAKVLEGTKPADLAVDQASRFELAVNLKTAKALGLSIPQSILLRADRVIE
jgi:putative ABC transport system substrate-binding protein